MKFFLVLLAVFKYILLFLLVLLLLIIVLAFIFLISPIRYSVTVNYKEKDVYLNVNATYLGKIVGFNFKMKNKQRKMLVRLFNKKINISPDNAKNTPNENGEQKSKPNGSKQNVNVSTKVAQKVTPTQTLVENTNLNNVNNGSNVENSNPDSNAVNTDTTNTDDTNTYTEVTVHVTEDINVSEQNVTVNESTIKATVETESEIKPEINLESEIENKIETEIETKIELEIEDEAEARIEVEEELTSESTDKIKKRTSFGAKIYSTIEKFNSVLNEKINKKIYSAIEKFNSLFGEKIYSVFENFNSVLDKIYSYIYNYQNYPYRDKLFKKFKKIFHNLFDALIPKTFDISGKFYIKDPALTGKTLGYVYALYGISNRFNISLDADFETEKTDVTALISGKIIIFKLVQPVVSFIWLGLKAEAKRRGITRFKLIKILIKHE